LGSGDVLGANLFAYCDNEPVLGSDPSGHKAVDITTKLLKLMKANALKFAAYMTKEILLRGLTVGLANSFKYFFNNSKSGGAWDLKRLKDWQLSKEDWFVFKGRTLRFDDPGNIHFGYVGSVMFPITILRMGGGIYQVYSGTSSRSYRWTFFDDPRDSSMILFGNILFRADILKTIYDLLKVGNRFKIYWLSRLRKSDLKRNSMDFSSLVHPSTL